MATRKMRSRRPKRARSRRRRRRRRRGPSYTFTDTPTPLRALLWMTWNASLALGTAVANLRRAPLTFLVGRIQETELHNERLADWIRMMVARLQDLPARRRPHYTRSEIRRICAWGEQGQRTDSELAADFVQDATTTRRWRPPSDDNGGDGADATIAPSRNRPPVHRVPDAVRQLCRNLWLSGKRSAPGDPNLFFGVRLVSRMVGHKGDKVSKSAVHNFNHEMTSHARPATPAPRIDPFAFVLAALERNGDGAERTRDPYASTGDARIDVARAGPLFDRAAVKALNDLAAAFLTRITATLAAFEARPDPIAAAADRLAAVQHDHQRLLERARLLHARMSRIRPRHRPHYDPELRKDILAFKARYRLSVDEIAAAFALSRKTLSDWNLAVDTPRERKRETPFLLCRPELRNIGDAIKTLVSAYRGIADSAVQAVTDACRTLCRRVPLPLTRKRAPRDISPSRNLRSRRVRTPIHATRPNHYWIADLTAILPFLRRGHFQLALLIDARSRRVLAWSVFLSEPTADDILALIDQAIAAHGKPQHFVSDLGTQFKPLKPKLKARGIKHHFGALGQKGSIPLVERCHRSVKETLDLEQNRTDILAELLRRLAAGIAWYNDLRPHESLVGATPHEVYFRLTPAVHAAIPATHRPADYEPAYAIAYALQPEQRLPYLASTA